MKNTAVKTGLATLAVGGLAVAGATGASAQTVIPDGHVDIIGVSASNGSYEVETHIGSSAGHFHVEPEDIGNYEFQIDLDAANATWDGDVVTIPDGVNDAVVTDLGFNYHGSGDPVDISWAASDGAEVTFEGSDELELNAGQHLHGEWTYQVDDPDASQHSFELEFVVELPDGTSVEVAPVNVTLVE